ncbi:hypothetical protein QYF61_024214 [Mycteria americana]|uniref:C2 domain-containing protein n=1 Tax=Mycteria americana TaxID=33587 RepID=A0AAN7MKA3_MYCAM|nr:hypothetical protein QYF61_024214 [Mycteria americana]
MLRLLVASAHIPGATGSGPGVHVSARFRGTAGYKGGHCGGHPRGTGGCQPCLGTVTAVPARGDSDSLPLAPRCPHPDVPPPSRPLPRRPQEHPGGAGGAQPHLERGETLAWPLGTRPLHPTASLTLRLRHWGQPAPRGDLGATMVSLDRLVADPGLPLALSHVPLLDPRGQPTGCTVTLRCSYVPRGTAGDTAVPLQGRVPPPAVSPGTPHRPGKPPAGRKEDFQVRVRVIEGHQLQGNDIKPVVTVLIGQHRFRTRIRAGNNPYYNEVFCQNFHRTPAQLAAEPIRIQVLDSRATRAKAVIGVFQVRDGGSGMGRHAAVRPPSPPLPSPQLDVGTVYRAPGRSLSWKWLSLQHPHRPDAGSWGYLRVSLAVLRAGEPVPEQEEPAGDEDVEANLLRPPPCAATLRLRIYRAEDLPQGGHRLRTRVMPPDANPAWNEVFFFPLRLPPICDEIQLAILGGSRGGKVLGTATLHLSQISSAGAELEEGTPGFLPCFGPSFLPFYGPRPDPGRTPSTVSGWQGGDSTHFGGDDDTQPPPPPLIRQDTGVAYRGRVLLELSTLTGTPDGRQRDTISPEDVARVQRHLPRRRFGLCGVFYSATMVPAGPELLRFELSLGNYGDAGDVTCKPAASVTPHGCPLFDGNRYHYLPWYGDKPVAAVTSSWEDAGHRWDALNLLRAMCRRLERNVAELRDARGDAGGDVGRRLLRQLAQDCGRALPQLEAQPTPTPLDAHLRAARLHLLRHVAAAVAVPPRAGWDALLPVAEGWLGRVAALAVEVGARAGGPPVCLSLSLSPQPQAGVPDVLLWLLRGERRVACARVPAPDLMFSRSGPGACGSLCGRIQTLFLEGSGDIRAQLRLRLWLGRVADSGDLPRHLEGTLRVYAETYENQTKLLGKWGPRGLLGRPGFSDSAGKAGLPRHRIRPPKGWRWDGPWTVEPQRRLLLDTETNVGEVLEEVYENESRRLGGEWGPAAVASTDASGAAVPPKEEVACPQGWHVADGWRVDVTGAVDEAGWEYGASAAPGSPPPAWHAAEKTYHTHRRRRWLRTRRRDPGAQGREQDVAAFLRLVGAHSPEAAAGAEAWEYGSLWGCRFHLQPRAGDACRRRRWHRGMVPVQPPPVAPLFLLEGSPVGEQRGGAGLGGTGGAGGTGREGGGAEEPAEEDEPAAAQRQARGSSRAPPPQPLPFILCTFQQPHFFQLRCYLFQALELAPRGTKATADPVAHVSFVHVSRSTRVLPGTLDPLWDQTLLFHRVLLYGDPRGVRDEPPAVVVEVFDQDGGVRHPGVGGTHGWGGNPRPSDALQGAGAFLGRSVCTPDVWLDVGRRRSPRLRRYPLGGPGGPAGELLAAFELLHDAEVRGWVGGVGGGMGGTQAMGSHRHRHRPPWQDGSLAQVSTPPWRQGVFSVPLGVRPLLRLVALEVLAWGLRGLRGGVRAPSLELQCGGQTLRTPSIADLATNPNFPINAFLLTLVRMGGGGWGAAPHPWVLPLAPRGDGAAGPQHLPAEEEYVPPIRLRVLDMRDFGYRPEVGQACVRGLGQYCCQPHGEGQPPSPGTPPPGSGTALPSPGTPCPIPAPSLVPPAPSLVPPAPSLPHPCPIPAAPWARIAQVSPPGPRHPTSVPLDAGAPGSVPQFPPVVPFAPCRYCPGSPPRKGLRTRWARERGRWGHQGYQGHLSPPHPAPHQAAEKEEEEEEDEEEDDWWSKFYAAMGDKAKSRRGTNRDRLKVSRAWDLERGTGDKDGDEAGDGDGDRDGIGWGQE